MRSDPELLTPSPSEATQPAISPGPPEFLAQYLRAEQQLGRLRDDIDPGKTAIVLLAVLFGLAAAPPQAPAVTNIPWPSVADAVHTIVNGLTASG
jgi:hypothetical protein